MCSPNDPKWEDLRKLPQYQQPLPASMLEPTAFDASPDEGELTSVRAYDPPPADDDPKAPDNDLARIEDKIVGLLATVRQMRESLP